MFPKGLGTSMPSARTANKFLLHPDLLVNAITSYDDNWLFFGGVFWPFVEIFEKLIIFSM